MADRLVEIVIVGDHEMKGINRRMGRDHCRVGRHNAPRAVGNGGRKPLRHDIDPVKVKLQRDKMRCQRPSDMTRAIEEDRPSRHRHRRDKPVAGAIHPGRVIAGIGRRLVAVKRVQHGAASSQRGKGALLFRPEIFQKHPHLAAAALPHVGAERGADNWRGQGPVASASIIRARRITSNSSDPPPIVCQISCLVISIVAPASRGAEPLTPTRLARTTAPSLAMRSRAMSIQPGRA